MLVKSLINDEKYYWIRIPKTASQAYGRIISPYNTNPENTKLWYHVSYPKCISIFEQQLNGFTVVRHPKDRFKSAIRFMLFDTKKRYKLTSNQFPFDLSSIEQICDFFTQNIQKIQELRIDYNKNVTGMYKPSDTPENKIFEADSILTFEDILYRRVMFITQTEFAFYPNVQIFRYENLPEFNQWVETQLGYDLSRLTVINTVELEEDTTLDFDAPVFDELTRTLFAEDYINFGYE